MRLSFVHVVRGWAPLFFFTSLIQSFKQTSVVPVIVVVHVVPLTIDVKKKIFFNILRYEKTSRYNFMWLVRFGFGLFVCSLRNLTFCFCSEMFFVVAVCVGEGENKKNLINTIIIDVTRCSPPFPPPH